MSLVYSYLHYMLANKIKYLMLMKEDIPLQEQKKIPNYLQTYFESYRPGPVYHPKQIIGYYLNTLDDLKNFLIMLRPIYFQSQGDQRIFKKFLMERSWSKGQENQINIGLPHLLFHLLLGIYVPVDQMVTFSFWDKLMIQLILAWCCYRNYQIQLVNLFQLIDMINGDHF